MNYRFCLRWLRAFREGPDAVRELYTEDFYFDDMALDAFHSETEMNAAPRDRDAFLARTAQFNNTDPTNGIGIHNFQIKGYLGDEQSGAVMWTWTAIGCASFLGVPTGGQTISTTGTTWQVYRGGRICRSSAAMDVLPVLAQLGKPVRRDFGRQSAWRMSYSSVPQGAPS